MNRQMVRRWVFVYFGLLSPAMAASPEATADQIFEATGIRGGLVVHLGCGDGSLTAALRADERFQVHGLATDDAELGAARRTVRQAGLYGSVSIDRWQGGERLPYIDNLVNLLVVQRAGAVSREEMLRVLTPRGVAYVEEGETWRRIEKPVPPGIDDWTHFLHDAGGNAVAHDEQVGPPRHLQWLGSPRWSRHHDRMASMSALVSAGGRLFYIMDEGSRVSIQLPSKWMLVARDAFNGTILWKTPIERWHSHLWPLKSGPTQLARRLVAVDRMVFVTLGIKAPLTALDAATGERLHTFKGTDGTEELVWQNGRLFALVNEGAAETDGYVPQFNLGDQRRVAGEYQWNAAPRRLVAIDAQTATTLWSRETTVAPLTLAADGQAVYYYDGEQVVSLERDSGKPRWTSERSGSRPNVTMNFGPRLVVHDGVVLFAGGDRQMRAWEAESGKLLWSAPHARGGYQSPEDLLVTGNLVWSAPTTSTRDSGVFTGRDLRTGEVKIEFPPNVQTYWFHHRCYIAKATDKYLLPSRTGIEFVDFRQQDWDIHHWVRGGCLYGVMPCNGLLYAPPHNCACYPEAKLYGFNALAPAVASRAVPEGDARKRPLEKGPAFGTPMADGGSPPGDWPMYRHDHARSGATPAAVPDELGPAWETELGGRLSAVVVAGGRLLVSRIDAHTVYALDAETGRQQWTYVTGGRVDSPPTVYRGRVYFGSADGWVYCLRAEDGRLVWRYRVAPRDERLMAFEQLESVWPVHGSVLVQDDTVYAVAGRSNFLDGGLRLVRLDAASGERLSETVMDDRDPRDGTPLQDRIQTLNMPVGLPDILSSDGNYVYMRSQQFNRQGKRLELGPHSGQPAVQGAVQRGDAAHLFAPMGFLDGTWFHRAYWVYGRSFAGGHAGYYQAGKYTPSARILVFDGKDVYGFGRKPQYYRWTTTIEHQLFATSTDPPEQARASSEEGQDANRVQMVEFQRAPSLNPAGRPLSVEAWVRADRPQGVVVAQGGPVNGYALLLRSGKPRFLVRSDNELFSVASQREIVGQWVHLAGVLTAERRMHLYVNGQRVASNRADALIAAEPLQPLQIGADDGSAVGNYRSPLAFTGLIDEVRIYDAALSGEEIADRAAARVRTTTTDPRLVVACTFEGGLTRDASQHANHGERIGAQADRGRFGRGLRFAARPSRGGGSFVTHRWTTDVPLLVRGMLKAGDRLVIAGPPDVMDEEKTFERLIQRDPEVATQLAEQDEALRGARGGVLWIVSAKTGEQLSEYMLPSLPNWDGLAAAQGKVYLSTEDGKVVCLSP